MKFTVTTGGDTSDVAWVPLVDSDSDGDVEQPSFVLGSNIVTDETGTPSAVHPDCRPVGSEYEWYHRSVNAEADGQWKCLFSSSFNLQALRDARDGPMDDSVDEVLLEQVMSRFQTEFLSEEGGPDSAFDGILDVLRQGIDRIPVGRDRSVDRCAYCEGAIFEAATTEEEMLNIQVCMVCNEWVHGGVCLLDHVSTHIHNLLCLGMRKRDYGKEARAPLDASTGAPAPEGREDLSTQPREPSLEPAAGAGTK